MSPIWCFAIGASFLGVAWCVSALFDANRSKAIKEAAAELGLSFEKDGKYSSINRETGLFKLMDLGRSREHSSAIGCSTS